MSPYNGCEYGCLYCSQCVKRGKKERSPWVVQVRENAPDILKKELKNLQKQVVCVWGYQPVEREYRMVRKALEVLSSRKFPVHVITKSDIILDDLDLLLRIADREWCTVTLVINTLDEGITKIFEPDSPLPNGRFETLNTVAEAGISTGIALSPVIPYITDSEEQLDEVISHAKEMRANYVLTGLLKLEDQFRARIIDDIKRHFPELVIKYRRLYEIGSSPDVRYSRRIKSRIRLLVDKYELDDNIPSYDEKRAQRQVSIESF
ncbi:MAG: radical SAM protein [Thermoplasmata archaeon]|nr:MAG: radical SAM protein [Thermoplasmata archaeon]